MNYNVDYFATFNHKISLKEQQKVKKSTNQQKTPMNPVVQKETKTI